MKVKLFFGFLFVSVLNSHLCNGMNTTEFDASEAKRFTYRRCERFNALHLCLSFSGAGEDEVSRPSFKKLGQLMSPKEREVLNSGKYSDVGVPMHDIYNPVWRDADASSRITQDDVDLLGAYIEDESLNVLFIEKFGASAPPSTPTSSPAIERANMNGMAKLESVSADSIDFKFLEDE